MLILRQARARHVVRAGTVLWRVHDREDPAVHLPAEGAVFSADRGCAVIESLLPEPKFTSEGRRVLAGRGLEGKVLSAVKTTRELLVSLTESPARDLSLVHDDVEGARWPSSQAWPEHELWLSGERVKTGTFTSLPGESFGLDTPDGVRRLTELLAPYRIRVRTRASKPIVFINYRTAGGTEEILRLDDELRGRLGDDAVFRDHRSLTAGDDFADKLIESVRAARVLLAVIGRRWEETYDADGRRLVDDSSDWVRREIAEAFRVGVCVVPVIVGVRDGLVREELPEDIRRLADLQFMHLRHRSTDADVTNFVDDLFEQVPILAKAKADRDTTRG